MEKESKIKWAGKEILSTRLEDVPNEVIVYFRINNSMKIPFIEFGLNNLDILTFFEYKEDIKKDICRYIDYLELRINFIEVDNFDYGGKVFTELSSLDIVWCIASEILDDNVFMDKDIDTRLIDLLENNRELVYLVKNNKYALECPVALYSYSNKLENIRVDLGPLREKTIYKMGMCYKFNKFIDIVKMVYEEDEIEEYYIYRSIVFLGQSTLFTVKDEDDEYECREDNVSRKNWMEYYDSAYVIGEEKTEYMIKSLKMIKTIWSIRMEN